MPTTPAYAFPYPAYTAPADVPADMHALAQAVETKIASDRRGASARVWQNWAQVLQNGTTTLLGYDTVEYDHYGMWVGGQSAMSALWPGTYLVTARAELDIGAPPAGMRWFLEAWLYPTSTNVLVRRGPDITGATQLNMGAALSTQIKLNQGDTVGIKGTHVSSAAQSIHTGAIYTFFEFAYLGPSPVV